MKNICLIHNANLMSKLNVMKLIGHESSPIHGNSQIKSSPFHTIFLKKILSNFHYPKHI